MIIVRLIALLAALTASASLNDDECAWEELPLQTSRNCTKFFRQAGRLYAGEASAFLVWSPLATACNFPAPACPNVPLPPTERNFAIGKEVMRPPAFYKVVGKTARSVSHSVDMLNTADNYYAFQLNIIEVGTAYVSLFVDFDECEGRNMLGRCDATL